jgi:hypothetical protein
LSVTEKKLFDVLSAEEFERILREYYESEVVFCRDTPVRELILKEILSNETEIKNIIKKFNTKISFLDKHIDRVVKLIVNDFCKTHRLYKRPLPKRLVKELINHYIEYVSLKRVQHQYTKSYSRRKRRNNHKPQSLNKESTPQTLGVNRP